MDQRLEPEITFFEAFFLCLLADSCVFQFVSQDEAARWKERGNRLWKENSLNLAIAYYSLAINFAPLKEKDLRATILSNRSLVYNKQGRDEEALSDARECVKSKPGWSKVIYICIIYYNEYSILIG